MRTYGLRFDVNCSVLFTEVPLPERPAVMRSAAVDVVESWSLSAEPEVRAV